MIYGVFYCQQKSDVFRNLQAVFRNSRRLEPCDYSDTTLQFNPWPPSMTNKLVAENRLFNYEFMDRFVLSE